MFNTFDNNLLDFPSAYPTRKRQAKSVFDAFRDFQAEASKWLGEVVINFLNIAPSCFCYHNLIKESLGYMCVT